MSQNANILAPLVCFLLAVSLETATSGTIPIQRAHPKVGEIERLTCPARGVGSWRRTYTRYDQSRGVQKNGRLDKDLKRDEQLEDGRLILVGDILAITWALPSDTGLYYCQDREGSQSSDKAYWDVVVDDTESARVGPTTPELIPDLSSVGEVRVRRGLLLKLRCVFSSYPTAHVTWSHSCKDDHCILKDNNRTLTLTSASLGDSGNYTCVATSGGLSSNHTVHVTVESAPRANESQCSRSITAELGSNVSFYCNYAKGVLPKPIVQWSINGTQMYPGDHRWRFSDNNRTVSLTNFKRHDRGRLRCTVSNEHGYFLQEFDLEVDDSSTTATTTKTPVKPAEDDVDQRPRVAAPEDQPWKWPVVGLAVAVVVALVIGLVVLKRHRSPHNGLHVRTTETSTAGQDVEQCQPLQTPAQGADPDHNEPLMEAVHDHNAANGERPSLLRVHSSP